MKSILFYSPDFSMCYSLLMYLQDKFQVTTTTNLKVIRDLTANSDFDIILMDTEPSKEIEELCKSLKEKKENLPVILTYVYQTQMKERDSKIRKYVNSVFYKPFDLNEVSTKLTALAV